MKALKLTHFVRFNQAVNQSKSAQEWGLGRWVMFQNTYLVRGYWSKWNRH